MKKTLIILSITFSFFGSAFATQKPAINLTFNSIDGSFSLYDYQIPNLNDNALVNLNNLVSNSVESICYKGDPESVIQMLDAIVKNAAKYVKKYQRFSGEGAISIRLNVLNTKNRLLTAEMVIQRCGR